LDGTLRGLEVSKVIGKMDNGRGRRVQSEVVFHGGEVNDRLAGNEEGGHAVAELLGGVWELVL